MLIPFNYSLGPVENHESISSRSWKVMLKLSAKAGCVICPFKVFTPFARLESVVTAFCNPRDAIDRTYGRVAFHSEILAV